MIDHPPYDHHYYRLFDFESNKKMKDPSSIFSQRIKQELSLLEKNIPGWVFVRSYEHRIDLMRAAIIGPPNTPYHHCLFFFDIELPGNYPAKPPKIHYQSYGIDLNPSLRLDGKITLLALSEARYNCLKQNWPGNSSNKEKWDPEGSNLLHVFHAIRNTILNKLDALEKNNRRVFVLTCEKMIQVLKEPPADFRDFVSGYFRKRAHSVLLIFRENKYNDSLLMIDLFVRMFKVFVRNGAYCKHHLCFLRSIEQKNCRINVEAKIRDLEGIQIDTEDEVRFDSVSLVKRKRFNLDYYY
ncbi:probable ubiquitin-conjugating enzyme e2 23 [Phtheirospermum japonicum]|uniref:Probable ubiquitin-conjugating enzyme e2 23 n=1 Tax=Phtheirospermum japonicum TaxID=374723 RepID=A0A830CLK1_9LAMI|nr:probable ubiquitin-conjugating enzyme e2 23 [Phtheirospermum japonicum]